MMTNDLSIQSSIIAKGKTLINSLFCVAVSLEKCQVNNWSKF